MILEVQHETRLTYSEPVTESITELRMEPASGADQSCRSFHLAVSPPAALHRYQDGFGNHVHHFNLLPPHAEVRVLAASVVETHPGPRDLLSSRAVYPLDPGDGELEVLDFLKFRGPVRHTPRLDPLLQDLRPRHGLRLAVLIAEISHYIRTHFQYLSLIHI